MNKAPPSRRSGRKISTLRIPTSELRIGMHVCMLDRPWEETPFLLQGFYITSTDQIDTLQQHCIWVEIEANVHVAAAPGGHPGKPAHKRFRRGEVAPITHSAPDELKLARQLHQEAGETIREVMTDARDGREIDLRLVRRTVTACVHSVLRNPAAMNWLAQLRDRDHYTMEHSLNVGLLAITFGRHLGLAESDLIHLGFSGMLHDVGKMRTPLEILNKPGKLTDEEFAVMRRHAQDGFDILTQHPRIYRGAVDVAYSHHETLSGDGYPRRLPASAISEEVRIVTICDIYDAITSDRCYKSGRSSREALQVLYEQRNSRYDAELVEEFIRCIGLYPAGAIVELRSGEVGIVISRHPDYRHLPKVLIVRDSDKRPCREEVVDLEQLAADGDQRRLVREVLANGSHGVRVEVYIRNGLQLV